MQLGFNMAGTEARFEHWLEVAFPADVFHSKWIIPPRYLEIGIAEGTTLLAAARKIQSIAPNSFWNCIGLDLWPSPFFKPQNILGAWLPMAIANYDTRSHENGIEIFLNGRPHVTNVRFALVDGNHSYASVKTDFRWLDDDSLASGLAGDKLAKGAIVAFHDACEAEQGIQGIAVREALRDLRLLPECRPYRNGWQFLEEVPGDKNHQGNGFVFVQKL